MSFGRTRSFGSAKFIAIAPVLAAIIVTATSASELRRLPSVSEPPVRSNEMEELRRRFGELEAELAEIRITTSAIEPVQSADFWEDTARSGGPIKLASLSESLLSGDFTIDVGGYVKADLIHDFNAIGSTDAFDPLTIPTDGRPGENTRLHARQTRLSLDFRPNVEGDEYRLYIEGDFFGVNDAFRLRHGFVRAGRLLAGQTWSTFMDESIIPNTLDFESARSVILDRRGLLRWSQPVSESLTMAVAVEDPRPRFDLDSAPAGDVKSPAPDLIGRLRYETSWGHLQSAGVVRLLRFRDQLGARDDAAGWGFNFTGRVNPHEFDSVLFQVAFGDGIESYRQAPDAAVDANGEIEVLPLIAWVVGYEVEWTDQLSSNLVYSAGQGTNAAFQLPGAPQAAEYVAANIIFEPRERLSYGVEYLYGTRTDRDNAKGEAHRVQFSVRYDLP